MNSLQELRNVIEKRIYEIFSRYNVSLKLTEAMLYSVNAGGKRLRPLLTLLTLKDLGVDPLIRLDVACAIEMIHTYSLIHDDLPAMDDDNFRRGLPTNHKVYGEALAILAGDGLLTEAFFVIANSNLDNALKNEIIKVISERVGANGMVGGQALDILAVNKNISLEEISLIHNKKTKELIEASLLSGAILARADEVTLTKIKDIALNLGMAFQIQDDIKDIKSDLATTGKDHNSDIKNNKATFPKVLGLDEAINMYQKYKTETLKIIEDVLGKNNVYDLTARILND